MFYERLKLLCQIQGVALSRLLIDIGLTPANTGKWKSGGKPSVDVLEQLADALNCTTDYLLGRSDSPSMEIPNDYKEIGDIYSKLDETGKTIVKAKAIEEFRRLER